MICPNCEKEIAHNTPQCPHCGCHFFVQALPKPQPKPQPIVDGRACPACGQTIIATAAFCKWCGSSVAPQAAAESTVEMPKPPIKQESAVAEEPLAPQQEETKPVQKQEEEKPAQKPQEEVVPQSETPAVAAQAAVVETTVKFCKHCGKPRNANAAFCKWCGAQG
jgi:predicted amidophosphoribosyltransferase